MTPCTTWYYKVENVMTALRGKQGSLVDIGSGDGRIVLGGRTSQELVNDKKFTFSSQRLREEDLTHMGWS